MFHTLNILRHHIPLTKTPSSHSSHFLSPSRPSRRQRLCRRTRLPTGSVSPPPLFLYRMPYAAFTYREPPHSGQVSSLRNFSTRFMPFSSFTLCRAFKDQHPETVSSPPHGPPLYNDAYCSWHTASPYKYPAYFSRWQENNISGFFYFQQLHIQIRSARIPWYILQIYCPAMHIDNSAMLFQNLDETEQCIMD